MLLVEEDVGEQTQQAVERVTGARGHGCPWWQLRDPFTQRVIDAHRSWAKGAADMRREPEAVRRGVLIFESALNAAQTHDIKQRSQPREQEAQTHGVRVVRTPLHAGRRPPRK